MYIHDFCKDPLMVYEKTLALTLVTFFIPNLNIFDIANLT